MSLRGAAALLLLPAVTGCLSVSWDRTVEGSSREYLESAKLETGRHTLGDVLEKLGPPDLILRAGHVDRAYYLASDVEQAKIVLGIPFTLGGRNASVDVFGLGLAGEDLALVRVEFDREGVLKDLQRAKFGASSSGEAIGVDDRIVSLLLEDRARMLRLREEDDDDEDVELDEPRRR